MVHEDNHLYGGLGEVDSRLSHAEHGQRVEAQDYDYDDESLK